MLASAGLDDRTSSGGYLQQAEELMADAVGAEHAFFSTCGSSLSVKAAMLAVGVHDGHLILGRDAHKSVVAGLISGLQPCCKIPDPPQLELETVTRPRDAFFSQFEDVKTKHAVGRIAPEQTTPYPPGIPSSSLASG